MFVVRDVRSDEDGITEGDLSAKSGGISGTVLDDLSGSYKTFVEAIKEIVSNSYDADASYVELIFGENFPRLSIKDDGAGMNPKQFQREYVRVGRSVDAKPQSPSGKRNRIGGKGIGSLAPARYCRRMSITTKTAHPLQDTVEITVPADGSVPLAQIAPYLNIGQDWLNLFTSIKGCVVSPDGTVGEEEDLVIAGTLALPAGSRYRITYSFAAERVKLEASIDFRQLRDLGEHMELNQVASLWHPRLTPIPEAEWGQSGTEIVLEELEEFVRNDLRNPGKDLARNISSKSGLERFQWLLSRMCPVAVRNVRRELQAKFEERIVQLLTPPDPLKVSVRTPDKPLVATPLLRDVYIPSVSTVDADAALCRWVCFEDSESGIAVRGYVLGSPVMIYPAELRGISVRVKGVELGVPTVFGAEALVTGLQHAAVTSHITGELHIEGVDARRDILPGREGLYPESPVYKLIKRVLVGSEDRLEGALREVVDEIVLRSEAQGSALGFVKKLDLQRRALMDAASAIAALAEEDETIVGALTARLENSRLMTYPDVEIRPEGKLASFTIAVEPMARSAEFRIDYANKRLVLPEGASYLQKTIDLAGEQFEVSFKHADKERQFCEVDPEGGFIYINWGHQLRGSMGDAAYIKHCLAAVVCNLPLVALNRYVQLIANRS